jgi:hypothetical protein
MFRFIIRWSKSKKDAEFYEEQKKDVLKWQKKNTRPDTATIQSGTAPKSLEPIVPMDTSPDLQAPNTMATHHGTTPNTVNTTTNEDISTAAAGSNTILPQIEVPNATPEESGITSGVTATKNATFSVEKFAESRSNTTARDLDSLAKTARSLFLQNDSSIPQKRSTQVQTSPLKQPTSSYVPPVDPPTAGPSRPRPTEDKIHVRHGRRRTFAELNEESEEDGNWVTNPNLDSDSDEEPPKKRTKHNDVQKKKASAAEAKRAAADVKPAANRNSNYRRPPQPTGVLFDIACNRCIRRGKECEKDANSASCVLCYKLKNRCDYGQRRQQAARKLKRKSKGKGKAKAKDVEDMDEVESEDDMSDLEEPDAGRRKPTADAIDTDEPLPSGYETSQPPPPSRSPSPTARPSRLAAQKARKAVAAAIAVDMASKFESQHLGSDSGESNQRWMEIARLGAEGIEKATAASDRIRQRKLEGK